MLCRLHQLTKHRVFTGPGFQVAAELGEAANGGQVLLSQDAWLRLQDRMHEASFPVVEQLGSYKLNAWPVPLPVYQACLPSLASPKCPTVDIYKVLSVLDSTSGLGYVTAFSKAQ